jgi:isopenicillin N synthase-like dioxygenase
MAMTSIHEIPLLDLSDLLAGRCGAVDRVGRQIREACRGANFPDRTQAA